jgi:CBS domain-containing protein
MLRQETVTLLAGIHPLDELSENDLLELSAAGLDYYPGGTVILTQGGDASECLYVIKRGTVRMALSADADRELVIDYRGEGEYFGLISVVSGDTPRASVTAEEDTICLVIPREKLLEVLQRNPTVSEKLLRSYFIDFIDKAYDETRRKYHSVSNNHRILFASTVGDLLRRSPVTALADVSIQEGSQRMVEQGVSSLVVVDQEGAPLGIVTDRDLREKVVARNRDPKEALAAIMTTPLVHVDAAAPCSDALLKMMRHNIHHILVVEDGRFKGMVTNHDFMVLQGTSPTLLIRKVSESQSLEVLAESKDRLERTVEILSREGAKAHHVTSVITEVTDRIVRRALSLIASSLKASPRRFSLAVLGQAGRRELSLHRRLTIAVVMEETADRDASAEEAQRYFLRLSKPLGQALTACGILPSDPCISPDRIGTPSEWIDHLGDWIRTPDSGRPPPGILDMRAVSGDPSRVEDLRMRMVHEVSTNEHLLHGLVAMALANRPPLGFFGRFVVDTEGEHRNELDLYEGGIRPLVDGLRVLACEHAIPARQSRERLAAIRERQPLELAEEVRSALEYLQTLRIHQQLENLGGGRELDDFLRPEEMTRSERRTLKQAFRLSAEFHDELRKRYTG